MSEKILIIRDNREEGVQVLLDGADITDQVMELTLNLIAPNVKTVVMSFKPEAVAVKVHVDEILHYTGATEGIGPEPKRRGGRHAKD